jgi:mRNA-degrading endonuclease toxin of MazEF toxin-antitoxin module
MPFPYDLLPKHYTFDRYPSWSDVYWHDFGSIRSNQDHTMADPHPAVVISNTRITLKGTVLIVPLSGAEHQKTNYAPHVLVTKRECPKLDKDSIVKTDQVYCVNVSTSLPDQYYITSFDVKIMRRVYEQLVRVIHLDKFLK